MAEMAGRSEILDDEILLAYVRGDLEAGEANRIDRLAREMPEVAAEIAMIRGVRAAVASDAADVRPPGAFGWARLSSAIDAGKGAATVPRPAHPYWKMAAAAVFAIGLWQVAVVPFLFERPVGLDGYAPVSETPAEGSMLRVAFAPDAMEGDIRTLLQRIGAEVTGGPGALGLWTLRFPDESARASGLEALNESLLVEGVQE
jgi:anti-sigma-K factor RskA